VTTLCCISTTLLMRADHNALTAVDSLLFPTHVLTFLSGCWCKLRSNVGGKDHSMNDSSTPAAQVPEGIALSQGIGTPARNTLLLLEACSCTAIRL
jgi:hypothetical protein